MTVAIFSFFGIIVGAALQYFFSRHLDSLRAHRDARTNAYTDYLRCLSESINPDQTRSSDGHEILAGIMDAKCRTCLYGSYEAIAAFAHFDKLGGAMENPEQQAAFINMVSIMRRDSTKSAAVAAADLQAILFGVGRHAA
ncbi:hypothetical protein [Xanthomonas sp. MUS 060]|uniref:hypothetical protein n=1 Tax=Xanthomonas sp. MUS 060 TaxID=1588031 RepID=UPI001269E52E|nr:hypothetical protein [Xanthomonas sp. MUS 060]